MELQLTFKKSIFLILTQQNTTSGCIESLKINNFFIQY